jgi:N-acetylglucosaminyldiphosphoundecaprenol N-acetyl-beta-D-mannosaminyltransferase
VSERFNFGVHSILGTHIHAATTEDALDAVHAAIKSGDRLMIGVVNAAKIVRMGADTELSEDVNNSDLILADGMSVVLASRILGKSLPERVTGIDLMDGILERGMQGEYRVYCLGASEEVSSSVEQEFFRLYPGVNIVGRRNGYFSDDEESEIVDEIAQAKPDVLLVAMSSPKKERFMARWSDKLNATVVHGVGGSFDVVAGKVKRAPEAWQRLGLEWLYRVKQEPGRLWKRYLVTNTLFGFMVLRALFGRIFGRQGE